MITGAGLVGGGRRVSGQGRYLGLAYQPGCHWERESAATAKRIGDRASVPDTPLLCGAARKNNLIRRLRKAIRTPLIQVNGIERPRSALKRGHSSKARSM